MSTTDASGPVPGREAQPGPEEVAAIVAVLAVLEAERASACAGARSGADPQLDAWVSASRVSARRAGFSRGPWRLAGRLARRDRA